MSQDVNGVDIHYVTDGTAVDDFKFAVPKGSGDAGQKLKLTF
jgi:hypothetical protein